MVSEQKMLFYKNCSGKNKVLGALVLSRSVRELAQLSGQKENWIVTIYIGFKEM